MSRFDEHPTVRSLLGKADQVETAESSRLAREELKRLAFECGADDCGIVSINDPALDGEREHVLHAFPAARILLAIVCRMHREPVRSQARSVANLEFHRAGDEVDRTAAAIVRRLEDRGIRALNPGVAFPMELDRFPARGWVVSHKIVAQAAGLGRIGIHRTAKRTSPAFSGLRYLDPLSQSRGLDNTVSASW